jgi:hypothetical protein
MTATDTQMFHYTQFVSLNFIPFVLPQGQYSAMKARANITGKMSNRNKYSTHDLPLWLPYQQTRCRANHSVQISSKHKIFLTCEDSTLELRSQQQWDGHDSKHFNTCYEFAPSLLLPPLFPFLKAASV